MPGVTISAGYGAGGSIVAPRVAARLGLPLLDRAISSRVADQLHCTVHEATTGELRRSLVGRFITSLVPLAGGVLGAGTDAAPPNSVPPPDDADFFREQAESIMHAAMRDGAVILGRGGAAAFHDAPDVLRVRLFGSTEARIAQAARIEHIDEASARTRLPEVDRARAHYVRRLYGMNVDDPLLFDLQLDSTLIPLAACAELIAIAYLSLPSR